jgi:hypothetical protein
MRAIAPVIGGPIFAWSLTPGHKYPFNYWFAFLLQSCLLVVLMALTFLLDRRLNYPKGMLISFTSVYNLFFFFFFFFFFFLLLDEQPVFTESDYEEEDELLEKSKKVKT